MVTTGWLGNSDLSLNVTIGFHMLLQRCFAYFAARLSWSYIMVRHKKRISTQHNFPLWYRFEKARDVRKFSLQNFLKFFEKIIQKFRNLFCEKYWSHLTWLINVFVFYFSLKFALSYFWPFMGLWRKLNVDFDSLETFQLSVFHFNIEHWGPYRVCLKFGLTKRDDYFWVTFDHFWIKHHFLSWLG